MSKKKPALRRGGPKEGGDGLVPPRATPPRQRRLDDGNRIVAVVERRQLGQRVSPLVTDSAKLNDGLANLQALVGFPRSPALGMGRMGHGAPVVRLKIF